MSIMSKKVFHCMTSLCLVSFCLILFHLFSPALEAGSLDRDKEIVVVQGSDVPKLLDYPITYLDASDKSIGNYTGQIYAYSFYAGVGWTQIPFQIEEITDGDYFYEVTPESGDFEPYVPDVLDSDDEIVVDATDLGDNAPQDQVPDVSVLGAPMYRIAVSDPLTKDQAYFYLFVSDQLNQTFVDDYVTNNTYNCSDCPDERFEGTVDSPQYSVGFAEGNIADLINKTGGGSLDVFDQLLIWGDISYSFISCVFPLNIYMDQGPSSSEFVTSSEVGVVIDGPVRVIMGITRFTDIDLFNIHLVTLQEVHFSRSQVVMPLVLDDFQTSNDNLCDLEVSLRFDFNSAATGMQYYDELNNFDVIDGSPGSSWDYTLSHWRLVSGDQNQGTMAWTSFIPQNVIDSGLVDSLYVDDSSFTDSHDRPAGFEEGHYGCNGILVPDGLALFDFMQDNPGEYDLTQKITFLAHDVGNVGQLYQDRHENPLQVIPVDFVIIVPTVSNWGLGLCMLLGSLMIYAAHRKKEVGSLKSDG